MDLKNVQALIKDRYRADPAEARIPVSAQASETDAPIACSLEAGRAIQSAQAHAGVGRSGTAACSGDLLVGALAACAQLTCQMVASCTVLQTLLDPPPIEIASA